MTRLFEFLGLARRWKPTHKHKKGGLYRLIRTGLNEADHVPVAIYDDATGATWVRPLADFNDGRFTPLT